MALSAIGSASGIATTERSSASRADDTHEAESFAGMFASAMHAPKHEAKAPTRAEGTSELDQDEADAGDGDTGNVGESAPVLESKTPAPANEVVRAINALDPELQAKLARVISRVEQETGHDVSVAETFRSQARQNALYAQGRTTDGPVVTWTQSSKHSQGRAVDVMLDNGTASPEAYQALQRIANEEGLRTLGAKDPGHLELRGNANVRVDATSLKPSEPADATGSGQVSVARLAEVARVADVRVERPATVASVARVAQVAQSSASHAVSSSKSGSASSNGGSRQESSSDSRGNGYTAFSGFSTRDLASPPGQPVTAAAAPTASDAAARAERVMSAMDSAPARSLSHITMSVDGANGTTDRVHVSLRGTSLDTTIDTGDARVANLLRARSDELSQALRRDGVELRELRVRAATDTNTVTAAAAGQGSQSSGDATTQSRFGRGDAWQKQQDQQDQQDRQRSQQERGRQQQRQRRGGER